MLFRGSDRSKITFCPAKKTQLAKPNLTFDFSLIQPLNFNYCSKQSEQT